MARLHGELIKASGAGLCVARQAGLCHRGPYRHGAGAGRVEAVQHALAALTEIAAAEQILIVNGTPLDARQPLSAYRLPVAPARSQLPRSCTAPTLKLFHTIPIQLRPAPAALWTDLLGLARPTLVIDLLALTLCKASARHGMFLTSVLAFTSASPRGWSGPIDCTAWSGPTGCSWAFHGLPADARCNTALHQTYA